MAFPASQALYRSRSHAHFDTPDLKPRQSERVSLDICGAFNAQKFYEASSTVTSEPCRTPDWQQCAVASPRHSESSRTDAKSRVLRARRQTALSGRYRSPARVRSLPLQDRAAREVPASAAHQRTGSERHSGCPSGIPGVNSSWKIPIFRATLQQVLDRPCRSCRSASVVGMQASLQELRNSFLEQELQTT